MGKKQWCLKYLLPHVNLSYGKQHWQFEHPWVAKEIREDNEKGGEMNYNSTGAMRTGSWEQETETFGDNMLRLSSCSGLIMAENDDQGKWPRANKAHQMFPNKNVFQPSVSCTNL